MTTQDSKQTELIESNEQGDRLGSRDHGFGHVGFGGFSTACMEPRSS